MHEPGQQRGACLEQRCPGGASAPSPHGPDPARHASGTTQVAARSVSAPTPARPPTGQPGGTGLSAIAALAFAAALVLGILAALLWHQSTRTIAAARPLPAAAQGHGR